MELEINFDDLTLGELEEFESISGMGIDELSPEKRLPTKALIAFVYLSERRHKPKFTVEDARKLKITEVSFPNPDAKAAS